MSHDDIREIANSWGLAKSDGTAPSETDLLDHMAGVIEDMLLRDRRKFTNALYRLDVSDAKVSEVMKKHLPPEQYREIARIILAREMQKAETRKKYSPPPEEG